MGLKALLVYPEMPPTYWSMKYALRFIGKKASFPPLGLETESTAQVDAGAFQSRLGFNELLDGTQRHISLRTRRVYLNV